MKTRLNIHKSLTAICSGSYSRKDLSNVIGYFHKKCKRFIYMRFSSFGFSHFNNNIEKEIHDLAYDFIGPIFCRNNEGNFYKLSDYFDEFLNEPEEDLDSALEKFLFISFRNEYVKYVKINDGFGNVVHSTATYLCKKHNNWEKISLQNEGPVIRCANKTTDEIIKYYELLSVFSGICPGSFSKYMEKGLIVILEEMEKAVPLKDLVSCLRENSRICTDFDPTDTSPDLALTIVQIINETIIEIDRNLLSKYVHQGKLDENERQVFIKSVNRYLYDLAIEGQTGNLRDYLSEIFDEKLSFGKYRRKYRSKFEFVIKESKAIFSAKIKNILKVK